MYRQCLCLLDPRAKIPCHLDLIKLILGALIRLILGALIRLILGALIRLILGALIRLILGALIRLILGALIRLILGAPPLPAECPGWWVPLYYKKPPCQ